MQQGKHDVIRREREREREREVACFESHEQFLSYLATVTITGDRAA
jgi:hypothetical protein